MEVLYEEWGSPSEFKISGISRFRMADNDSISFSCPNRPCAEL